jgi:hypothetical protein
MLRVLRLLHVRVIEEGTALLVRVAMAVVQSTVLAVAVCGRMLEVERVAVSVLVPMSAAPAVVVTRVVVVAVVVVVHLLGVAVRVAVRMVVSMPVPVLTVTYSMSIQCDYDGTSACIGRLPAKQPASSNPDMTLTNRPAH